MNRIIRIGSGSAWWGDRIEPAALNAERGDLDYLCFETMAEATISAAQVRARRDPSFPGYDTYLDDRMQGVLPGVPAARHADRQQPGLDQSERRRRAHRGLAARPGQARRQGSRGQRRDDHRSRARADRHHHGERPADGHARAEPDLRRGLSRRRADRRSAAGGRADRGHRPGRRPVDLHGADDVRVRLGPARSSPTRPGQRHRAPPGVRRAGHRRLLQRPRVQGRAGAVELRLPDRGGRGRRQRGDQQGGRNRRRGEPDDGEGAAPLRGPRSRQLHHAGRRGRFHHHAARAGRPGPRAREPDLAASPARRRSRCRSAAPKASSARTCSSTPGPARCAAPGSPSGSSRSDSRSWGCRPRRCASISSA